MDIDILFLIIVLVLSIVLHEVAHGYAANMLGDPTARLQGRLSLNPIKHIDPIGSVIIPGILVFSGAGILFGWAKPVPYNPYNLRNQRFGEALVAGAGPAVNIFLALLFGALVRFSEALSLSPAFVTLAAFVVYINLLLALFNMVPVPPLDGSKILKAFLPFSAQMSYARFEGWMNRYGFFATILFLFIFITFLWPFFFAGLNAVFSFVTGVSLGVMM